jgi:hypothetical protein
MVEKKKDLPKKKKMTARRRSVSPVRISRTVAVPKPKAKTAKTLKKKASPKRVVATSTKRKSPVRERSSPKRGSPSRKPSPKRKTVKKVELPSLESEIYSLLPENITEREILKLGKFKLNKYGKLDIYNWENHNLLQKFKPLQRFKEIANRSFTKNEHKKFRSIIDGTKNITNNDRPYLVLEELWVFFYLQPIMDELAEDSYENNSNTIWHNVFNVKVYHQKNSIRNEDATMLRARFSKPTSGKKDDEEIEGHWTSKKPGDKYEFDPYEEYQIRGTHQFCQTYSLMYLLDQLPKKEKGAFKKYYTYAEKAIEFILNFYLPRIKKYKHLLYEDFDIIQLKMIELLKNYRMTVNCIDITYEVL